LTAAVLPGCAVATNRIPRKIDEETLAQEKSDPRIGRDVSATNRAILRVALSQTSGRAFNELLASMPNVGEDSDFIRNRD
jgi:hypothetical protein